MSHFCSILQNYTFAHTYSLFYDCFIRFLLIRPYWFFQQGEKKKEAGKSIGAPSKKAASERHCCWLGSFESGVSCSAQEYRSIFWLGWWRWYDRRCRWRLLSGLSAWRLFSARETTSTIWSWRNKQFWQFNVRCTFRTQFQPHTRSPIIILQTIRIICRKFRKVRLWFWQGRLFRPKWRRHIDRAGFVQKRGNKKT